MKKVLLIIFITFCTSCAKEVNNVEEEKEIKVQSIDCKTMLEKVDDGGILIDVRSEKEYEGGSLQKAINIPLNQIKDKIEESVSNKDTPVIVFCQSGGRSKEAANTLKELGYKYIFDLGSINNCN